MRRSNRPATVNRRRNPVDPFGQFELLEPRRLLAVPDITGLSLSADNIDEGGSTTLSGEFTDDDLLDMHNVNINWGDGTSTSIDLAVGVRTFSADHTYVDDDPITGTASDVLDIDVTVTDNNGDSDSDSTAITVNNVAPTLGSINLSASSIDESESVTVSGSFSDPALGVSTEAFTGTALWSDGVMTTVTVDGTNGTFSTSRTFPDDNPTGTPSDDFTVSISIADDDTGSDTATSPTLTVNNVAPVITSLSSDATFDNKASEGGLVTVLGEFTDIGVEDTHTATVDWGDGTIEPATVIQGAGSGMVEATHEYTTGGIFEIIVTVTDDDTGAAESSTTAVVTGVGVVDGVLFIIGTSDADEVAINQTGKDRLKVRATFIPEDFRPFVASSIDKIISYLCEGEDHVSISNKVTLPAIIHGGADNDHLNAGGGPTVLLGDGGDDELIGQGGRNILIGGTGFDKLTGGKLGDVLIGGSTESDNDDAVLMDAAMAWAADNPYGDRVSDIAGLLSVLDDFEEDNLTGSSGRDLFFDGSGDALTDVKKNETVL